MTLIEEIALSIQCPRCRARTWCTTETGERAPALHARRTQPVRSAFTEGYKRGFAEARDAKARQAVPPTRSS